PRQPLEQLFPSADKNALDLMFRMLRLNPLRRITALEALQHPYLRSNDEKQTSGQISSKMG
ncbi:hypothetical protein X801_08302, partial [Opisthorchis viverrini]